MKGKRLKALGVVLVGGLALLFAGCQQQVGAPPQGPTTVAVEGLYRTNTQQPVDPNNVNGAVIVRAKVALGSVVPDKVQFLLDNNVEYEVSFGVASQGIQPQQATYTFEWNLDTRALANLAPKYPNGPHAVKVRLVKGTQEVAISQAANVVFNNADIAVFKFSGNAINKGGNRYYGGGDVSIEVVPVLYSGRAVQSVKLDLSGPSVDLDPNTPGTQSIKTLTAAPYVFTIPYSANKNNGGLDGYNPSTGIFTVTFNDSTTLPIAGYAVLDGNQVLVDTTGLFSNNPPFTFSDLAIDFTVPAVAGTATAIVCRGSTPPPLGPGGFANNSNLRVGLSALTLDAGVGGDKLVVDVLAGSQVVLSNVEVPLSGGGCPGAGALSGLGEGGFYVVKAKAVKDDLGNSRSTSSTSPSFAIDETKPTLTLKTGWDNRVYFNFNSSALTTNNLAGADLNGNSIPSPGALTTLANPNDPPSGNPPVASGLSNTYKWTVNGRAMTYTGVNIPGLNDIGTALGLSGPAPQDYYTLTAKAVDNAGNESDPLTLTVLYDDQAPNVVFTAPSQTALTGGTTFTATAQATDNVDLRQGRIYWSYQLNASTIIRFEAFRSPVRAFGGPGDTSEDYSASLKAIKPAGGNFDLFAWVEDQARNAPATASLSLSVTPANLNNPGTSIGVSEAPPISQTSGGSTQLTITHTPNSVNPANLVAVRVYLWERKDVTGGVTYHYYQPVGQAAQVAPNTYQLTVTAPANLSTPEFLIVLEYDNGLATGYRYDYNTHNTTTLTPDF